MMQIGTNLQNPRRHQLRIMMEKAADVSEEIMSAFEASPRILLFVIRRLCRIKLEI